MPLIDCPISSFPDEAAAAAPTARWQDLPPAFLCHILELAPYKRADVKAVCCGWRAAINASISAATLPASDLPLLRQLTNIQQLAVTAAHPSGGGSSSHQSQQHTPAAHSAATCQPQTWPPSSRATTSNTDASSSSSNAPPEAAAANGWSAVQPHVFRRLRSLRLSHCPAAVQQLAAALASSSSQQLSSLQDLELSDAGDVSGVLPALLQHCGAAAGALQLQRLCLAGCNLQAPHCLQLQQLPRLRGLLVLDLSGCGLAEVPAAACCATGLTKLVLRSSLMQQLPPEIGQLQQLKVLDLSGCTRLRGLCSSFRQLTALQELHLAGPSGIWLDYSSLGAGGTGSAAALPRFVPAAFCGSDAATGAGSSSGGGSAAAARAALPPLLPALEHQQQLPLLPQLAGLGALSCLDLSSNRDLMVLPRCLSLLRSLRLLDVRGCGLRWLNEELLECSGLRTLLLSDNVLLEVPEEIRRLQQLQVLDLGGCSSLWHLPRSLLQLPALVRLTLPSRGVGQQIVEELELRAAPEVEVLLEPPEGASDGDDDDFAAAAGHSDSGDSEDGDD